jgi:ATP-dependent helicase/nuclease subunit B
MPAIERICIQPTWATADLWDAVARHALSWLAQRGQAPRDAVLLLPFAALVEPARAAFQRAGGWQPRIETVLTLSASLAPPAPPAAGDCSGDPVLDRLSARAMLLRQTWGRSWARRDADGFEAVVAAVVQAAQALCSAAGARAPDEKAPFWDQARGAMPASLGPAATESLLLQLALEWAAASAGTDTAMLHELQPAAWVVLRFGGVDAAAEALLDRHGVPSLLIDLDPDEAHPFDAVCQRPGLERWLSDDFEDEAQAAAAVVLEALQASRTPVALVALDRELVRRVRALLARQQVPLVDETGWKLATTAAATRLVALLRAAPEGAPQDACLEWLKSWPRARPQALDSLEAQWRGRRKVRDPAAAAALWEQAQTHLRPFRQTPEQPLAAWLRLLTEQLEADGLLEDLADDAAGVQVLAALHLSGEAPSAWQQATASVRLTLGGFTAWVRSVLEEAPFLPPPDPAAQVVLTPLSRAFGRPFAQIVVPGADHKHLGSAESAPALISDAMAESLGLDHARLRRHHQRLALAHIMLAPRVTLLRRHRDAEEPLSDGAPVQGLLLGRAQARLEPWPLRTWSGARQSVPVQAVPKPQPRAAGSLPASISATQLEALRSCPYRFFARAVLRLDEPQEVDTDLAKRDYGTWLHAVLYLFHSRRRADVDDAQQLAEAADDATHDLDLDPGELLPFRASFEQLAPAYLSWQQAREKKGWFWADGESDHRWSAPELQGLQLQGRLDRLDHGAGGRQALIDYKTGSGNQLAKLVRQPLEDTQLAFYAALLGGGDQLSAAYLALDDPAAPRQIEHLQVHASAQTLLASLGDEWQRLQAGAPLAALGEGQVCENCEARGLCRRDHWAAV